MSLLGDFRYARKALTQKYVAAKLGVSQTRMHDIENARNRTPSLDEIEKLSELYEAPVEALWIFYYTELNARNWWRR